MHYTLNMFCLYCMLHNLYYVFFCNIYHKFLLDIIFDILIMLYCVFVFCILDKILLIIIYIVLMDLTCYGYGSLSMSSSGMFRTVGQHVWKTASLFFPNIYMSRSLFSSNA